MKKIKANGPYIIIIAVLVIYILFSGLVKNGTNRTSQQLKDLPSPPKGQQGLTFEQAQVESFLDSLPNGDINSEKCKELISDKDTELSFYNKLDQGMFERAETAKDKDGYAQSVSILSDSKYIYSHKLCLISLRINRYDPLIAFNYSTSTGMTYLNQIVDLGSNEVIAEDYYNDRSGYRLDLWNKSEESYFPITKIWLRIKEMK